MVVITAMNLIVAVMKLSAAKPLHAWVRSRGNGRFPRPGGWDDELVETTKNPEVGMRRSIKALVLSGALMMAGLLSGASPASATTAAPTLIRSNFACSGSICEVGPGNVGILFAAGLDGTGGPTYYGPECNPYIMTVVSGSLPPGLHFGQPACEYTITGPPTRAGTYAFPC